MNVNLITFHFNHILSINCLSTLISTASLLPTVCQFSFQPHPFHQPISSHFNRIPSTIFHQFSLQLHPFYHLSTLISTASLLPSLINSHFNRIPSAIYHQFSFQQHPFYLLSSTLSSNLKWNHVDEIVKKSRKRLYCLSQLKRSGLKPPELIQFYRTCTRPITEYTSPVFHDCLPAYLSKDIESIQRRAMRISFPSLSYKEALDEAGLISLSVRRQSLTNKLFTEVTTDRENKLHHLLPEQRTCHYNLRKQRRFKPVFKTNRCKSSFIIHNSQKLFN